MSKALKEVEEGVEVEGVGRKVRWFLLGLPSFHQPQPQHQVEFPPWVPWVEAQFPFEFHSASCFPLIPHWVLEWFPLGLPSFHHGEVEGVGRKVEKEVGRPG